MANRSDEDDYESRDEGESDGDNREEDDDHRRVSRLEAVDTICAITSSKKKTPAFPESNFVQFARFLDTFISIHFSERRLCRVTC